MKTPYEELFEESESWKRKYFRLKDQAMILRDRYDRLDGISGKLKNLVEKTMKEQQKILRGLEMQEARIAEEIKDLFK